MTGAEGSSANAAALQTLLRSLDRPSREFTPIPFWFLNGNLTHREIRRQLKDFRDHGVYGVVLHPRIGLPRRIGYLSPAFFRYLRTAVRAAAEMGMTVVLYDEGMYPSGSACGQVTEGHPELASRGLGLVSAPLPGDTVVCETPEGFLVERPSGGTIRGIHYGEDDGEPGAPLSADILNPAAVRRFISLTHEAYYREFAGDFGKTILGFFTDEPSVLGRNAGRLMPWTRGFLEIFRQAGGRPEGLTALFSGRENSDTALYRQLILERESTVYYGALSRWCLSHGVALMGHPHQSDDIEVLRHFQIPGQDLVYRWVSPERGDTEGMDSVMAKCGADMAWLTGRRRNLNECFGACNRENIPWYFTGADMKWYLDYLAVRGVNLFIPHAFYYSLSGKRSAERPPDVGPGSIWWPRYRLWARYMCRLSCLMTCCEIQADIALLCRNRALFPEKAAPLVKFQRGFRYLPESLWPECREEDGSLVFRGHRFRAVVGPESCFPGVSHDPFSVPPDLQCDPPAPDLRAAKLCFRDRTLWMLVNQGGEAIETVITLPVRERIGAYDLWSGEKQKAAGWETESGRQLSLHMERNESLLLFACSEEEWNRLPEPPADGLAVTDADFTLTSDDPERIRKVYTADIACGGRDLTVTVNAEEMAELHVNGRFFGAAFWSPQRFRVPAEGRERLRLRLTVTGSPANRYSSVHIPYGLTGVSGSSPR